MLDELLQSLTVSELLHQAQTLIATLPSIDVLQQHLAPAVTSFVLIVAAEMGDKSQLVCMTLASRHKAMPVLWGAIVAFAALNTLAVLFGAAIAHWLPETVIASIVALLFAVFGINALRTGEEQDDDEPKEASGRSVFLNTFLLIAVAEFGDKTQLAVAALGSTATPVAVWVGSTAALTTTSALGILAGRALLKKIPLSWLHKISGIIFLILASAAGWRAYSGIIES